MRARLTPLGCSQLKLLCRALIRAGVMVAFQVSVRLPGPLLHCGVRTAAATASRVCYARALEL